MLCILLLTMFFAISLIVYFLLRKREGMNILTHTNSSEIKKQPWVGEVVGCAG
ncbi:hypothetical protein BDV24DRAFT_144289 [Aspergillus arachidicola]|uniref:Uncharacterized protein n=1 Tax=Aspergillus arachidicola TaxID=656916 RepID=A0A5N6XQN5_9EURO|nr:hypothetical protein BDV24DRAFT_144289 [Aspergillus arachidicola]